MFRVTIHTETTLKGPCVKMGQYAAVVEYRKASGAVETREIYGEEDKTTYHRTTLLACIKAMEVLNTPCEVYLFTADCLIEGAMKRNSMENWERAEWKTAKGEDVKNKSLWQQFQEHAAKHRITIECKRSNKYSNHMHQEMKRRKGHV